MKLSLFDFHLPPDRIAQKPVRPRDQSRLLVLNRKTGAISHRHFFEITEYLKSGDVLVLNNTKVFPARLNARKESGGKIEVFLLKPVSANTWECLLGGKGRRVGLEISMEKQRFGGLKGVVIKHLTNGTWHIRFNRSGAKLRAAIHRLGTAPTPPYVKRLSNLKEYQTVFAKKSGSVAAPTAGFHFTNRLMNRIRTLGVQIEYVTLHVGYGTFQPVKETTIERHRMHPEHLEMSKAVYQRLVKAKREGRRIIAVGTTTVRTLESLPRQLTNQQISQSTNIFIIPGYKFKMTDAMITNFHLPKSTLFILVSAFAGRTKVLKAYETAIKKHYRFYSFGDAMLIT
ncbi:MAG: tRNA preQ1(34) S-adenosylmethionine ribosyltransferase-isomerase QueA [bacterium]|nr:tRNA preQ1(34) S-adenosylmethionine ribosyltransferase-isomerase QueA [bacterium]